MDILFSNDLRLWQSFKQLWEDEYDCLLLIPKGFNELKEFQGIEWLLTLWLKEVYPIGQSFQEFVMLMTVSLTIKTRWELSPSFCSLAIVKSFKQWYLQFSPRIVLLILHPGIIIHYCSLHFIKAISIVLFQFFIGMLHDITHLLIHLALCNNYPHYLSQVGYDFFKWNLIILILVKLDEIFLFQLLGHVNNIIGKANLVQELVELITIDETRSICINFLEHVL